MRPLPAALPASCCPAPPTLPVESKDYHQQKNLTSWVSLSTCPEPGRAAPRDDILEAPLAAAHGLDGLADDDGANGEEGGDSEGKK